MVMSSAIWGRDCEEAGAIKLFRDTKSKHTHGVTSGEQNRRRVLGRNNDEKGLVRRN